MSILSSVLEHRDTLVVCLAQRILSAEDIDDILQETFTWAFTAIKRHGSRSPRAYLFVIAGNLSQQI